MMKRALLLTLITIMMMSGAAHAQKLQMGILDGLLTVDTEVPAGEPDALPVLDVVAHAFDADLANRLLMDGHGDRDEQDDPMWGHNVSFGEGDGKSEYMLVEITAGRICYSSPLWETQLIDVMQINDEMKDNLHYYPEDREVDGFPRVNALEQAEALVVKLGIWPGVHVMNNPRVLTIDPASYDVMLQDLSQADYQVEMPRSYLEPYNPENSGYLILYNRALDGVRLFGKHYTSPLALFITKDGVQYLETEQIYDVMHAGNAQVLLTAGQALAAAEPAMKAAIGSQYVAGEAYTTEDEPTRVKFKPVAVERIRPGYRLDSECTRATPTWEYTFLRTMQQDIGNWQTRTFDNGAALGIAYIDALTGEYMETIQY